MIAILNRHDAADGSAKYLLQLDDGRLVEAVYLYEAQQRSFGICLSTQVGCGMGCVFCATARQGLQRNLSTSEIVEQARVIALDNPRRVPFRYVSLAGMGEPLDNFESSIAALKELRDQNGGSLTEVSLSTIGNAIHLARLVDDPEATFRIYLSLHSPTDQLRGRLIPGSRRGRLGEAPQRAANLVNLMDLYGRKLGDRWKARISYLLLKDINDSSTHLEELGSLLEGRMVSVQLLFWNAIERAKVRLDGVALPVARVGQDVGREWLNALAKKGIAAYAMPSYGGEVLGGCGQLSTKNKSLAIQPVTDQQSGRAAQVPA